MYDEPYPNTGDAAQRQVLRKGDLQVSQPLTAARPEPRPREHVQASSVAPPTRSGTVDRGVRNNVGRIVNPSDKSRCDRGVRNNVGRIVNPTYSQKAANGSANTTWDGSSIRPQSKVSTGSCETTRDGSSIRPTINWEAVRLEGWAPPTPRGEEAGVGGHSPHPTMACLATPESISSFLDDEGRRNARSSSDRAARSS